MPIYEYKCENGHVFDVIQKMTDEALTECQECGAPRSASCTRVAVHFKGSGFYNTDYGKKKGGATAPARRAREISKSPRSPKSSRLQVGDSKPPSRSRATRKTIDARTGRLTLAVD